MEERCIRGVVNKLDRKFSQASHSRRPQADSLVHPDQIQRLGRQSIQHVLIDGSHCRPQPPAKCQRARDSQGRMKRHVGVDHLPGGHRQRTRQSIRSQPRSGTWRANSDVQAAKFGLQRHDPTGATGTWETPQPVLLAFSTSVTTPLPGRPFNGGKTVDSLD